MAPHDPTTPEDLIEDFLRLEKRIKELGEELEDLAGSIRSSRERTPR